jgi:hypothetical protein
VTGADTAAAIGSGEVPVLAAVRLRNGVRPVASGLITRGVVDTAAFLRDAGAGAGGWASCGW